MEKGVGLEEDIKTAATGGKIQSDIEENDRPDLGQQIQTAAGLKVDCDFAAATMQYFDLAKKDMRTYSPLTLAYIGDAVYDLIIRTMLVEEGNAPVNRMHKRASGYVKASAQKELLYQVEGLLTDEEQTVFKRGRNAKSPTMAKNATMADYRTATGFEALVGYLYLTGRMERIFYLVKEGIREPGPRQDGRETGRTAPNEKGTCTNDGDGRIYN